MSPEKCCLGEREDARKVGSARKKEDVVEKNTKNNS